MIKESTGKISDELYALGSPALPAYFLMGETPVLFDAGMTFMGPLYLRELKKYLGEANRLAYCFLTHSHYDHCGAAPFLKKKHSWYEDRGRQFSGKNDDYLSSLEKLKKLEINLLMMGHFHVLTEGAQEMVTEAVEATKVFGKRIEEKLNSLGGDQEAVVKKIFQEDYVVKKLIEQEERPFLINLKAQVKAVAERK